MVDVKNGKQQSDLRRARIDFSWWCIDIDSNDLYCATCSAYVKDHNAMRNCPKCGLFMSNTTEQNKETE